jgi:DNA-binding MarR family transcriptional regulator
VCFEFESSTIFGVSEPEGLSAEQLAAYFALMEVSSLLRHAVEGHLRAEGGLSYVQFEILARLVDPPSGRQRMTDLADGIVYSRSGLTYQADRLEKAGLIAREPSPDDERSTTVAITEAGRELVARVLPGHVRLVHRMLLEPLDRRDTAVLTDLLERVRDRMRAAPPRSAVPRPRRT